jgi:hypothetical protein
LSWQHPWRQCSTSAPACAPCVSGMRAHMAAHHGARTRAPNPHHGLCEPPRKIGRRLAAAAGRFLLQKCGACCPYCAAQATRMPVVGARTLARRATAAGMALPVIAPKMLGGWFSCRNTPITRKHAPAPLNRPLLFLLPLLPSPTFQSSERIFGDDSLNSGEQLLSFSRGFNLKAQGMQAGRSKRSEVLESVVGLLNSADDRPALHGEGVCDSCKTDPLTQTRP